MKKIFVIVAIFSFVVLIYNIEIVVPSRDFKVSSYAEISKVEEFDIPPTKYGPRGKGVKIIYSYYYEGQKYNDVHHFHDMKVKYYKKGQKISIKINSKNPNESVVER